MKGFLIHADKCVGCHACQIGCKDEHCGNCWMPYAQEQPESGQFWMKVDQKERGQRPQVKVSYIPTPCQHCENAPCIAAAKDAAVYRRDDGLVIIDPEKAKGQRQLVDACPYGKIFWNEEFELPQKCTGCAHLLDDEGSPIRVPRCVDNCPVHVIEFGELDELDLEGAEVLHPEYGTKPHVYYKGLPKKFIAGTVFTPADEEIVEGAQVVVTNGEQTYTDTTNSWGDFWIDGLPDDDWTVTITGAGKEKVLNVSTVDEDRGLGDIPLA